MRVLLLRRESRVGLSCGAGELRLVARQWTDRIFLLQLRPGLHDPVEGFLSSLEIYVVRWGGGGVVPMS